MYKLKIHHDAEKELGKAPKRIRKKAFIFLNHLMNFGTQDIQIPIKTLGGKYKKSRFLEAKIDKDYRIFFRKESNTFYIRFAGTHNKLGTG